MGGKNTKHAFIAAIQELSKTQGVTNQDDSYWERFWDNPALTYEDFFVSISADDVRQIRNNAAGNLTALCFKLVERLSQATQSACTAPNEQACVLNCVRLLTRVIPFLFEDPQWRMMFWATTNIPSAPAPPTSTPSAAAGGGAGGAGSPTLALGQMLLNAVTDLLFCPDFTVKGKKKKGQPEKQEDLSHVDSCEHLWEAGIACSVSPGSSESLDSSRTELLALLLVCFSESLYYTQEGMLVHKETVPDNKWLAHFTSVSNRHILPLLTSLLNVVCSYDPVGYGVPYVYALYSDTREHLVTIALQFLVVVLDYRPEARPEPEDQLSSPFRPTSLHERSMRNLFYSYVARLHQKEDLEFVLQGLTKLLSNPLARTYLPSSRKRISFVEELLVITWKLMEANKKFLSHVLQSPRMFDLVVPTMFFILDAKASASKVGQLHVGIFTILLMSGERNFGVRLNKPFLQRSHPDLPAFTGTHADLVYLTLHKVITSGLPRLQPLYDSLLTIMVNVSPYLKSLSMVTCTRLLHLMESFSTPWFLCAKPHNHYLVFYLLEAFNNVVQYQFDGNTNLVYCMIRSRAVFKQLMNLTMEDCHIGKQSKGGTAPKGAQGEGQSPSAAQVKGGSEDQQPNPPPPRLEENASETRTVEVEIHPQNREESQGDSPPSAELQGDSPPSAESQGDPPPSVESQGDPPPSVESQGDPPPSVESQGDSPPSVESQGDPPPSVESQGDPPPSVESQGDPPTSEESKGVPPQGEDSQSVPPLSEESQGVPPQGGIVPGSVGVAAVNGARQPAIPDIPTAKVPLETVEVRTEPTTARAQEDVRSVTAGEGRVPAMTGQGGDIVPDPLKVLDKGKRLGPADLLPLTQGVASNNAKLVEPQVPTDFTPTAEWLLHWKEKLPIQTIQRLLHVLVPQVEKLCVESNVTTEKEVLEYLKNGTLVGLLPIPHPILIRKYQTNMTTVKWFHTYIWGLLFVKNYEIGLWTTTHIKLFHLVSA